MTRAEFSRAVTMAQDGTVDLSGTDCSSFDGCGLAGFGRVTATLRQVAYFIRWQCLDIFGTGFDSIELDNCARIARKSFDLVGVGSDLS